jgi:hypothetical protein
MEDLRAEIRAAFETEQAAHPPAAGLRHIVFNSVMAHPPAPNLQWLAVVAAALLGILVVVGLMSTRFAHRGSVPVPAATAPAASPSATPSGPEASPAPTTVAAAAAVIRATVTGAHPLLLPTAIPANWSAVVSNLSSSFFTVAYTSPDGAKEVDLAIEVPNPPPPGPNSSQSNPSFHGDPHSLYQVGDTTQPTSPRFLIWNEPGTWSEPNGLPGVPYMLSTRGLTDAEFWAIANSLHS